MSLLLLYRPRYDDLEYGDGYIPRAKPVELEKRKEVEFRKELESLLTEKVTELKAVGKEDVARRNAIEWEIEELLFMVMYLDD